MYTVITNYVQNCTKYVLSNLTPPVDEILGMNNLKINDKVIILIRRFDDSHVCSLLSLAI